MLVRPAFQDMTFVMANPPLGLGYLAATLEANGFPTTIVDLAIKNVTTNTFLRFIEKREPLFVGITALTCYYEGMKELSNALKERIPHVPVVIGGVHATALPELSLIETKADLVVIGEGEETIVEIARILNYKDRDFSGVKGVGFLQEGRPFFTPPRPLLQRLDDIPWPAWEKMDPRVYPKDPHGFIVKHKSYAPVITTRGCPFDCHYCASCQFWRQTIRHRSASDVVDEIQFLMERFDVKEIHFWDDNLTLNKNHVRSICKELVSRNIQIACTTPNGIRVDTLDEKTLKLMKAAGFYYLIFSVESGSIRTLEKNGKRTSLLRIVQNFRLAKSMGFYINCFFMLGFPGESVDDMRKTIRFAKSIPFHMRSFFIVKPLPGSRIFDEWQRDKDMRGFKWREINYYDGNVSVSDVPRKVLEGMQHRAYMETVSRVPDFLVTVYIRFVKFFHTFQLRFLIQRALYFLVGFKPSIHF